MTFNKLPNPNPKSRFRSLSIPKTKKDLQIGQDSLNKEDFFLNYKHREFHTHIIGSTGKGKSKYLELLIRSDIENRDAGICVIDPTGRLYRDIIQYVSLEAPYMADRFVFMDLSEADPYFTGFNPIPIYKDPELHFEYFDYNCRMIIKAVQKVWGQADANDTPRLEKWLPNIMALVILNNLTLLESTYIADTSNQPYVRHKLIKQIQQRLTAQNYLTVEPILADWLEFDRYNLQTKSNLIESSFNRLRRFLSNKTICGFIGQQNHVLDIKKVMDESKILLVNLHGGTKVTNDYASLMGILLIHEIVRVAKQFRNDDDPILNPFFLYIDEFGQLVTQEVADALDLVRKRKLYFTLAHQTIAQLQDEKVPRLMSSVGTNCRVKVAFGGLNFDDAQFMADELFGAHYDFDTPKHTLWGNEYEPTLRKETVRSSSNSSTQNSGGSNTRQSSKSNDHGVSERDDHDIFSNNERVKRHGSSQSSSESDTSSWSSSQSNQTGESETFVTDHIKHRVVKSITWNSYEELRIKKAGLLKSLPDRHAIVKLDNQAPVEIEVSEVNSTGRSSFTDEAVSEFKQSAFERNKEFYVLKDKAFEEIFERRNKLLNESQSSETKPFPGLEKSNPSQKQKPTRKKRKSQFR